LDEKAKREARQAAAVDNQAAASKTAPQKLKERHEARKAQAVMDVPTAASEDKKAPDANSVSAAPAATKPAGPAVTEEDDGIVLRWR